MATVSGVSGAWAELDASLRERRIAVSGPHELTQVRDALRLRHQQGLGPLYNAFDEGLQNSEKQLVLAGRNLAQSIELKTQPLFEEAKRIEQALAENRSRSWLQRCTTLLLPTLLLKRRKQRIYKQKDQITSSLQNDLLTRQQHLNHERQNRTQIVSRRHQQLGENAAFVEQLLQSPELAGAQAELEVLACLRRLPSLYHVCCDLRLSAHRKIRFAGEYLQSAQIDYLVVGPSGVFVLEVKRWSRQFIARGQYLDPYEQAGRASYLCYDLLRSFYATTRVRSLIVNCGSPLPPPHGEDYHAQVVPLSHLIGCLTRSRREPLDAAATGEIIRVLKSCR